MRATGAPRKHAAKPPFAMLCGPQAFMAPELVLLPERKPTANDALRKVRHAIRYAIRPAIRYVIRLDAPD